MKLLGASAVHRYMNWSIVRKDKWLLAKNDPVLMDRTLQFLWTHRKPSIICSYLVKRQFSGHPSVVHGILLAMSLRLAKKLNNSRFGVIAVSNASYVHSSFSMVATSKISLSGTMKSTAEGRPRGAMTRLKRDGEIQIFKKIMIKTIENYD